MDGTGGKESTPFGLASSTSLVQTSDLEGGDGARRL